MIGFKLTNSHNGSSGTHRRAVLLLLTVALGTHVTSAHIWPREPSCSPPVFNEDVMPKEECRVYYKACVHAGTLVMFDPAFAPENATRALWDGNQNNAVRKHCGLWNHPSRGGTNSDALVGHGPCHVLSMRPASRMEANPALQGTPHFSRCVVPLVLLLDWPFNFGEVYAQAMPWTDMMLRQKKMFDKNVAIIFSQPMGMELMSYQHVLWTPYTIHPVLGLDDVGSPHAGHGMPVCYEKMVVCKFAGFPQPMAAAAEQVIEHLLPTLPLDPLSFGPPTPPGASHENSTTLRVAIEARQGACRTIKNLHALFEACEKADAHGFQAGTFQHLSCRMFSTGDTPDLHGVRRFHANMGAARSAHVLVVVHGAGAVNSFFMEGNGKGEVVGNSALLEVRPCTFGSKRAGWPDAYMAKHIAGSGNRVWFFGYNVEDTAQCIPSDYEAAALKDKSVPMRGDEAIRARDQHVVLKPSQFIAALKHVASILRNPKAYEDAEREKRRHIYTVREGLVYGPLGVPDVDAHIKGGAAVHPA